MAGERNRTKYGERELSRVQPTDIDEKYFGPPCPHGNHAAKEKCFFAKEKSHSMQVVRFALTPVPRKECAKQSDESFVF